MGRAPTTLRRFAAKHMWELTHQRIRSRRQMNRGVTPLLLSGLQVVFLAEFVQEFELGFQPVDVFFFGF